ncbi:MAG TPA: hypothetical protein VKG67_02165 [Gallionellaceae bacterium]|nr:hypothetical protein [Gallionellaceae bacterium]
MRKLPVQRVQTFEVDCPVMRLSTPRGRVMTDCVMVCLLDQILYQRI